MRSFWLGASLILALSVATTGAEKTEKSIRLPDDNPLARLKPGPGSDVAAVNCAICHSTDYIVRQPGSDAQHWEAEVKKMVTVFGAPISDADAKVIVDYLTSAYGPLANQETPLRRRPPSRPRRYRKDNP